MGECSQTLLVMNLCTWLWRLFLGFLCQFCQLHLVYISMIIPAYTSSNHT